MLNIPIFVALSIYIHIFDCYFPPNDDLCTLLAQNRWIQLVSRNGQRQWQKWMKIKWLQQHQSHLNPMRHHANWIFFSILLYLYIYKTVAFKARAFMHHDFIRKFYASIETQSNWCHFWFALMNQNRVE